MMRQLLLLLLIPSTAWALPDTPTPKATTLAPIVQHQFYNRQARVQLTAAVTLAALDTAQTCRFLANGKREDFLPTQHCGQVTVLIMGEVAVQEFVAWQLHRHGHHKVERFVRFVSIVDSTTGLAYSKVHGGW